MFTGDRRLWRWQLLIATVDQRNEYKILNEMLGKEFLELNHQLGDVRSEVDKLRTQGNGL